MSDFALLLMQSVWTRDRAAFTVLCRVLERESLSQSKRAFKGVWLGLTEDDKTWMENAIIDIQKGASL